MLLLKHIDDNLYLVDTEAEIKEGNYFYCNFKGEERILKFSHQAIPFPKDKLEKIIAQLKDQLSGVPLFDLPDEKVDVEKLADLIYPHSRKFISVAIENSILKVGFIAGYNLCLSDNKERKYTEVDIYNLMGSYLLYLTNKKANHTITARQFIDNYLQSLPTKNLQQYDGKRVEIEAELNQCDGCNSKIPIVNGIHKSPYPSGSMVCQKHKYGKIIITKIV